MELTTDYFLGKKVTLNQSKTGLRATSDSVLVSALVSPKSNETVLDVGAGNGIIGCCICARTPCRMTAIEIQPDLCCLIETNARLNNQNIQIIQHDIFKKDDPLKGKTFHHVVTNPPFYENTGKPRQNKEQKTAYVQNFDLSKWLEYCLKHLRSNGSFNLIHRPELLPQILPVLIPKLGNIEIFPVVPKQGDNAKRVLIRGYLSKKGPVSLRFPLIMHTKNNRPSKSAEKILRLGEKI